MSLNCHAILADASSRECTKLCVVKIFLDMILVIGDLRYHLKDDDLLLFQVVGSFSKDFYCSIEVALGLIS